MSTKKTIKINPDYFKRSNNKKSRSVSKKMKKIKPVIETRVKPNNLKKQLIQKIKNHQQKKKSENEKNKTEKIKLNNNFKDSLNYLQKMIQDKKKQKKKRSTIKKNKDSSVKLENKENIKINTHPFDQVSNLSSDLISDSVLTEKNHENIKLNNIPNQLDTNDTKIMKSDIIKTTVINTIQSDITDSSINNSIKTHLKKKPSWGCLKNGNLPTYSQYRKTLKKQDPVKEKIKISMPLEKPSEIISERKNKLDLLKQKFSEPQKQLTNKIKKIINKKITETKKTIKIYKLGKNKKTNKIGVLIKSQKTRKNIKKEVDTLKQKSVSEIKIYLKKHNIIKIGSMAPENVLRQMYEDSKLAGDIYNNSSENLIHNYINE
jgi:hypothetical protein